MTVPSIRTVTNALPRADSSRTVGGAGATPRPVRIDTGAPTRARPGGDGRRRLVGRRALGQRLRAVVDELVARDVGQVGQRGPHFGEVAGDLQVAVGRGVHAWAP